MTVHPLPQEGPADVAAFKAAFRSTAGSVSIITAGGIRPVGFTATSLTSLSVAPPMVSFNITRTSSSWPAVSRAQHLAAHLLHRDQEDLARTFATSGIDRFATAGDWVPGPHGLPLLQGALARLVLAVHSCLPVGDSAVVVSEVLDIEHTAGAPLLYHDGSYRHLPADAVSGSDPYPTHSLNGELP